MCVCFRGGGTERAPQLEKVILDYFAKIVSTINPADMFISPK